MFWLAALSPAWALTAPASGPSLDLGAGLGLAPGPRLGLVASAGWWFGHSDEQYALARYLWLGPSVRVDVGRTVEVSPLLEVRRGVDLLVVGVAPFLAAGPHFSEDGIGATARAGVITKLRRTRTLGLTLRLEAGANWYERPSFVGGVLLGVAYSDRAGRRREPADAQ